MTTQTSEFPSSTIKSPRAWNKSTALEGIVHAFSPATQAEVAGYVRANAPSGVLTFDQIQNVPYDAASLPNLVAEVDGVRPQVDNGFGFVVFPAWEGLNVHESRVASWLVDNAFGEPRVQDDRGNRLIEIFNASNDLSMQTGARYHETREGNSPHTDAPQAPADPDYLCLRCVSDGQFGGENILVTADSIYNTLLASAPDVIETLGNDFFFQCRGVNQVDGRDYFARPIFEMDQGGLRMRFLDHYIAGGHEAAGVPLTAQQERAIHAVNSVFQQSDLQFRARLEPGQQVVFANKRMLHARTEFIDLHQPSATYDPAQLDDLVTANRLMDRTWSYKRDS